MKMKTRHQNENELSKNFSITKDHKTAQNVKFKTTTFPMKDFPTRQLIIFNCIEMMIKFSIFVGKTFFAFLLIAFVIVFLSVSLEKFLKHN